MQDGSNNDIRQRGRPAVSQEKVNEMRGRIGKAARRLFQEEGYGQVSIRKIAKEVGCSPMTLYKYYDSKVAILQTLWEDIFEDVFTIIESSVDQGAPPVDSLKALSLSYVAYWLNNSEHYRLVFMAEGITQSDVNLFVDQPELAMRYFIFTGAIAEAYQGDLSPEELKLKSDALICCLHGIVHNKVTISGYQWGNPDELIATLIDGIIPRV